MSTEQKDPTPEQVARLNEFWDLGKVTEPSKQRTDLTDLIEAGWICEINQTGNYYYSLTIVGAGVLGTSMEQQGIERNVR